jgi:hypothetical protein
LLQKIKAAAGIDTWESGFAEATFVIGEKLQILFQPRFVPIWRKVGVPPGPWQSQAEAADKLWALMENSRSGG